MSGAAAESEPAEDGVGTAGGAILPRISLLLMMTDVDAEAPLAVRAVLAGTARKHRQVAGEVRQRGMLSAPHARATLARWPVLSAPPRCSRLRR